MSTALADAGLQFSAVFEPCLPAIAAHIRDSIGLLKPKVSFAFIGQLDWNQRKLTYLPTGSRQPKLVLMYRAAFTESREVMNEFFTI